MEEKLPAGCTRPTGRRLLVEGTIVLIIFSLFLEITNVINYLVFVGIWYVMLFLIIIWFKNYTYCITKDGITIRSILSRRVIKKENFRELFVSQGPIAKRLRCGSIYIILKNGKTTVLVDIKYPEQFLQKIQNSQLESS